MIPIKLSQKTTPFACKEHIPSLKTEEMARFLRLLKKIYQNCVNKCYMRYIVYISLKHKTNFQFDLICLICPCDPPIWPNV